MRRLFTASLALVALGLAFPAGARAQAPPPAYYQPPVVRPSLQSPAVRPPISPYLNLANGVGNPAVNYYGIVRPELRAQAQQQQTSQQLRRLEGEIEDLDARRQQRPVGVDPGPQRYYFNYSHYYPTPGQR